jgi:hypothetical protein
VATGGISPCRRPNGASAEAGFSRKLSCHVFRTTGISLAISKLAAPWKMRRPWPRTKTRARQSSMTTLAMKIMLDEVERITI